MSGRYICNRLTAYVRLLRIYKHLEWKRLVGDVQICFLNNSEKRISFSIRSPIIVLNNSKEKKYTEYNCIQSSRIFLFLLFLYTMVYDELLK